MRCWLLGYFVVLLFGFSSFGVAEDFQEGKDYRKLTAEVALPSFIKEEDLAGKVQLQKYFSLACKPCFALDMLLDKAQWKPLRDKINIIHIHRLKRAEKGNGYNNYDHPAINAYHLLEEYREQLQWSSLQWKSLLLTVHKAIVKEDFHLVLQEPYLMGQKISKVAAATVSNFPEPGFVNDFELLDDDSVPEKRNEALLTLTELVGMTSIPALVIGGKYLVERKHVTSKGSTEPDLNRMLAITDYLVNKVIQEES